MRNLSLSFLTLAIALMAVTGSTQSALGVETPLTDYSRAVMLENPVYYWTFNETNATDVAQEVMRRETESQMLPIANATRVASYSSELGNAASFTLDSAFAAEMVNRGLASGSYAFEFWMKADPDPTKGYIADFLGEPAGGDSPGIIHDYTEGYMELWYGGPRTGNLSQLGLPYDQWHHVVLAVHCDADAGTADQVDVAIDGVVSPAAAYVLSTQLNLTGDLTIGAWATLDDDNNYASATTATKGGSSFQGQLDEFAVYDLAGLDAAGVTAKVTTLASHYNLATTPIAITPFAPVAAEEVSYAVVGGNPVSPDYLDSTGSQLSDGIYAGNDTAKTVGYYGVGGGAGFTELEFDLGEAKTLDAIWINHYSGGHWGISAPVSVELSFSIDGVNFSDSVLFEDFNNSGDPDAYSFYERCAQVGLEDIEAQYVRTKFSFDGVFLFLSEVQFMEVVAESPQIAGDANKDGKVDGSDVTILANNWQYGVTDGGATWDMGDFNGDGKVDGSDVTILANNWQYGVSAAAAAVPEPSTIILLLSAVTSLLIWRRAR